MGKTRLTRNSYKRKIILFGIFIFVSISLISTGFAAWVMSSDAKEETEGNVEVGLVTDASIKIEFNKSAIEAHTFYFEPAKDDHSGRVRLDSNELHEVLELTVEGEISNPEILATDGFTIQMSLPEGMQKAVELNYIVAPECVAAPVAVAVDGSDGTFTYTIKFKWGSAFGGQNPSLYFDNDSTGLTVADEDVKVALENLRACVYNYYDELTAATDRAAVITAHASDAMPKFKLTLFAQAN